jgi:hypothetical protein
LISTTERKTPTFREAFKGNANVSHRKVYANMRANIARPLPQVQPHPPNDYKVMLLCGGPSLQMSKRNIAAAYTWGWKVFAVNGTYNWALDNGYLPSLYAQLDARPFNARFLEAPLKGCKYLLCSQCDPSVFAAVENYSTYIWHATDKSCKTEKKILDEYYMKRWYTPAGGSSIGTRAIGLAYMLGIRTLRIFGFDACLMNGQHHPYAQPENDDKQTYTVRVGRRRFRAHAWMLAQLDEWLQWMPHIPDDFEIAVEGNGLIAHVINETARMKRVPRITLEK